MARAATRLTRFNMTSLALGMAFLYLPIVILVIYSFNASRLVTVWGGWSLRWFTPTVEVKLCGHATLASAHTLWETGAVVSDQPARFHTLSGWLTCRRKGAWIEMDFPAQVAEHCPPPAGLQTALGCELRFVGANGMDYLVEVADEATLRALKPNITALAAMHPLTAAAQSDSGKTIKLLVGFPPGGSIDVVARVVAEKMKDELKANIVVENKPGASGMLGTARLLGQTIGAALVALLLARFPADGTRLSLMVGVGFALVGAMLSMLRLSSAGSRGAERVRVQEGQRLKGE